MITINDIAKAAGVSHGTVSNVINGRGNVSLEKIKLVQNACQTLGYKLNSKAQSLRQGHDRTVAIILPGVEDERYAAMFEVFQREFNQHNYAVQLYTTQSLPTVEKEMLGSAINTRVSGIIAASCLDDAGTYYRKETSDLPLIFIQQTGLSFKDTAYAGFDAKKAGQEIGQQLKNNQAKHVGLFTDVKTHSDTALFLQGFESIWGPDNPDVKLVDCTDTQIELSAFEFFDDPKPFDYIVCADRRRQIALNAAGAYATTATPAKLITIVSRTALIDPTISVYELDYKRLAHLMVKAMVYRLCEQLPLAETLHLNNDGFRKDHLSPNGRNSVLRLLTMASPSTTALTRLLPYLEKTTGIHLELTVLPSLRDVYQLLQTTKRSRFDLIRMDVAWMDELAAKLFKPLNQIEGNWNHLLSQTIPELGQHYTSSDNTLYCLPYDPSTQLLFYRQDLFTDPTIKRQYFEYCRQELTVPKTFDEYNHIAGFFTRQNNPTSPTPYGSTIAIGNVVVSPSEFLVRLFACGGKLLDEQGYITVDTPQALAALQNYQQTYQYSDRFVYDIWKNALAGFADGSAAMTVVFINYASEILNSKLSSIAGKVGYAPVPGGLPLLGGGVIGITNDCADCQAASVFLQWLYSDLVAPVFTTLGGLSPCQSAYSNRDINERYPWLSATRHSFGIAQRRGSSNRYRNFSELKLETIIADNVQLAVLGTISAKQALHQAQSECDQYFIKA